MNIWDTAELWQSVHECSTISTYMSSPKHSQSEYTLWQVWWKSILVVPLTHPPSITPTASLSCYLPIHQLTSTVSMDTIKHAKNTAKRDHDPCLLPRGSYAWAQRHGSWYRTIQFNSLEWDMRAMPKKHSIQAKPPSNLLPIEDTGQIRVFSYVIHIIFNKVWWYL